MLFSALAKAIMAVFALPTSLLILGFLIGAISGNKGDKPRY